MSPRLQSKGVSDSASSILIPYRITVSCARIVHHVSSIMYRVVRITRTMPNMIPPRDTFDFELIAAPYTPWLNRNGSEPLESLEMGAHCRSVEDSDHFSSWTTLKLERAKVAWSHRWHFYVALWIATGMNRSFIASHCYPYDRYVPNVL